MTRASHDQLHALFTAARSLDGDARSEYLDSACGSNAALRREVEALLEVDAETTPLDGAVDGSDASGGAGLLARALVESGELEGRTAEHPETIGRYRIRRVIGEGGMGIVYEAEQDDPRRLVALKVIRSSLVTRSLLRRFRHEAQMLGLLQHPGIAQIHEAGTADDGSGGRPFFAMELIDGESILAYATSHALSTRARLELVAALCDGLHHAHQKGIVHRDLKPPNVLVTTSGQPKILDFGVARATDSDVHTVTLSTDAGQLIGTVPYMSPEQASGDPDRIDIRSDVYAVGVLTYELLTGRLPYPVEGKLLHEAVRVIREDEPSRMSSVDRTLRGDVETVVGKALEKEKERRYQSAAEFAADIRRFLANEPIVARPASATYQMRKFARRNKAIVVGVVATVLVSVIGAAVAGRYAVLAARRAAQLERSSYVSGLAAAAAALEQFDTRTAAGYLDLTPERLRGWEFRHLQSRLSTHEIEWSLPAEVARAPVVGPQGRRLFVELEGGELTEWDLESGQLRRRWRIPDRLPRRGLALHGPTLRFACMLESGMIAIGSLDSGRIEMTIPESLEDTSFICSWDLAGEVLLYRTTVMKTWDGSEIRTVLDRLVAGSSIRTAEGRLISPGYPEAVLAMVSPGSDVALETEHSDRARVVAPSPDGTRVVVGGVFRTARIYDARTLEPGPSHLGHESAVCGAAWSPDGRRVVTIEARGAVRIWTADGRLETVHHCPPGEEDRAEFRSFGAITPDGRRVAVINGSRVRVFPLDPPGVLTGHQSFVYCIEFSPDGTLLASSGFRDPHLHVWDPRLGTAVARLQAPQTGIHYGSDLRATPAIAISDDSRRLVSTSALETVHYDLRSGESLAVQDADDPIVELMQTLGRDHSVRITMRTRYGRDGLVSVPTDLRERGVGERAVSPDGGRSAFAVPVPEEDRRLGIDSEVLVYDHHSGERVGRLVGHAGVVYAIAFTPDGSRIATGGNDMTIRIWDARTFEQLLVLRGHQQYVKALAFSPDGTILASASGDRTVRLWDTMSRGARRAESSVE